jgi:alkanesulfonate monooxygenase SsuD/methylene tetrahydromethanopterin reductase-like flavin-dependent oxidoreductase (luciferase family)
MGDACMVGTPDGWVDLIGRFGEAGAQDVNFLLFSADLRADLDLVLSEVVPQVTGRAPLAAV